jgi:hypothetical protein
MHEQTLYPKTKRTLEIIEDNTLLDSFYLAGGTALALQLGHRKSVDLDFFTAEFPDNEQLIQELQTYKPSVTQNTKGTVDVLINETKVSFLRYQYPMLENTIKYNDIQLAHVKDIACMKISAISSRGSKKDFADLYYILEIYPLEELISFFEKKYKGVKPNMLHTIKALTFFGEAEDEPDPEYTHSITWEKIKRRITTESKNLL